MNLVELSKEVLRHAKFGNYQTAEHRQLSDLDLGTLSARLNSDAQKKAFWINVYNAFIIQVLANEEPGNDFYTYRFIRFKDLVLSFDDIEHGILRRSKLKWSLGYFGKRSIPEWEMLLRVDKLDPRIHFALNCGANSCPPITMYNAEEIDEQLDRNSTFYMRDSSVISEDSLRIKVPRLFLWYISDFGGFDGIKKMYKQYGLVPVDVQPKVSFLAYDWSLNIDNFANDFS